MLGRVTCAPSVTTQSESLEGASTKGGPIEPMLEIWASPGDLPVVPDSSQRAVDLAGSHRFAPLGGALEGAAGAAEGEAPCCLASTPSIFRVSEFRHPLWRSRSRCDLSSSSFETPMSSMISFISSVQPLTMLASQVTDWSMESVLTGLSEILFVRIAGQKPRWHLCTIRHPIARSAPVPTLVMSAPRAMSFSESSGVLTRPAAMTVKSSRSPSRLRIESTEATASSMGTPTLFFTTEGAAPVPAPAPSMIMPAAPILATPEAM